MYLLCIKTNEIIIIVEFKNKCVFLGVMTLINVKSKRTMPFSILLPGHKGFSVQADKYGDSLTSHKTILSWTWLGLSTHTVEHQYTRTKSLYTQPLNKSSKEHLQHQSNRVRRKTWDSVTLIFCFSGLSLPFFFLLFGKYFT